MTIDEIKDKRQSNKYDGEVHESVFRSYHILDKVIEMMERGDSKKTIFEMIDYLDSSYGKESDRTKRIINSLTQ